MAHFAQIDNNNNNVIQVIVVSNDNCGGLEFPESEPIGVAFCKNLLGDNTNWKQTSYNNNFRGEYAGIGSIYDEETDTFI